MISDKLKIAYRILFNLQFELEGYTDDLNQYITVIPDEDTEALYEKYRILPKKQRGAHIALIDVVPEGADLGRPGLDLEDGEVFRYQVKMSPYLLNRCHLASYDFLNNVLYASNNANHVVGSELLLSLPIQNYNSANAYLPGHIVASGGNFYKALQANNSGNVHGVGDAAYWKQIAGGTAITQADLRTRASFTNEIDYDTIMVIEISHSAALPAAYRLLDGATKCREVSYKMKLLMLR